MLGIIKVTVLKGDGIVTQARLHKGKIEAYISGPIDSKCTMVYMDSGKVWKVDMRMCDFEELVNKPIIVGE